MARKVIIGIDPGKKGGIAEWIDGEVTLHKMPETAYDIRDYLISAFNKNGWNEEPALAVMELPPTSMGVNKGSGSVKLHQNHSLVKGMIIAMGFDLEEPRPPVWQKQFALGTRSSCSTDCQWKNKLKSEAQRLYPKLKVIHDTADALLILHYGLTKLKIINQ